MKHPIKLLLLTAMVLSSAHTYANQKDQEIIEQALLCQNLPKAPADIKRNTNDEKRLESYDKQVSNYISKAEKAISRNATGKPKKEIIDYSNYTTYKLKQPIIIRGISFSSILSIDYEDGYQTFQAIGKPVQNNQSVLKTFKKTGERFDTEIKNNSLTVSCTLVYSLNLPE